MVRADGGVGLCAHRIPARNAGLSRRPEFRHHQHVGAYLSLSGIALIYGRTGALNMAQIGGGSPDYPADPPRGRGLCPGHRRSADQERHCAVSLLAPGRPRGRTDPGLRVVLRRDGGTGAVRDRPRLLVGLRGGLGQSLV